MSDEHWSAVYDSARAVRVNAVRPFGFTDRQARFLVTVMAHSGSFLERQYCAFAGSARGQNSRDFVAGLVAREMRGNDRILLPVWHGITYDEVMRYSAPLAGRKAVSSADGLDTVAHEVLKVVHPQGSPLLVARDLLLEWGGTPPVITDSYWLDVVEASNRVPGAGAMIPEQSHWGRWSFPLPWSSEDVVDRGERLAWTAMQLKWTEAAEQIPVTPLTIPHQVNEFVRSFPGLLETCSEFPDLLIEYAPQLTIPGCEGDLREIIERGYDASCKRSEARRRASPRSSTALTNERKAPPCEEEWALRHPEFGTYEPSFIANAYFAGGIFGPEVSPYEHADHLFWLLSKDSCWIPDPIRAFLRTGMAEWAVWHWYEVRGESWPGMGELWKMLSEGLDSRKGVLKWTSAAEDDLTHRIQLTIASLRLQDSVEQIRNEFHASDFAGIHVRKGRSLRAHHRRREAANRRTRASSHKLPRAPHGSSPSRALKARTRTRKKTR